MTAFWFATMLPLMRFSVLPLTVYPPPVKVMLLTFTGFKTVMVDGTDVLSA